MSELRAIGDELVTTEELAKLMRCSPRTIYRLKRQGMPHVTWGRRMVRFRAREAMTWAEQQGGTDDR